jgi:DNA-binding response OmpR family regulator
MSTMRVLVIEDQSYLRDMLVEIFREFGYSAVGSSDPREALSQLASIRPSLIVLDMWMPTMNGRAFIDRLRADSRFADIPVLIVSGDRSIRLDGPAYRRVEFLMKPFEATTLVDRARALIGSPLPASA